MSRIYDMLTKRSDLHVFLGRPAPNAWAGGPKYETFVNGHLLQEGDSPAFVGEDLVNPQIVLVEALVATIIERARELNADAVIIRLGTEDAVVEKTPVCFDTVTRTYRPAQFICRTRAAFTNLTQGAYK